MLTIKERQMNWKEIKDGIKTIWGNVDDQELDQTGGDPVAIESILKKKTFEPIKLIRKKLKSLMDTFDNETDKAHKLKAGISSYKRNPV